MILFSTESTYNGITSTVQHKVQQYVKYNDIMEAPAEVLDGEEGSMSSTDQDGGEEIYMGNGPKPKMNNKKSVHFHDVVQVHVTTQKPITYMEKHLTWYSVEELRKLKANNYSYIKFLSLVGTEEINNLLNHEVNDTENDDCEEVVCLRGLERFIPTTTCCNATKKKSLAVALQVRRKNIVQNVLREQSRIRKELPMEHPIDELLRGTAIEYSKSCRDYAYQIAQKSFCFTRIGV
jgi:hypothetical protein